MEMSCHHPEFRTLEGSVFSERKLRDYNRKRPIGKNIGQKK
jgi:hypothetical protein